MLAASILVTDDNSNPSNSQNMQNVGQSRCATQFENITTVLPIASSSMISSKQEQQVDVSIQESQPLQKLEPKQSINPPKFKTIKIKRKTNSRSEDSQSDNAETDRKIKRLEKKLAMYQDCITRCGDKELTLDQLGHEDNSFTQLKRLEESASKVWDQISELKGKSNLIIVMSDNFRNVNCTQYAPINERIKRFFNKNIQDMPDYVDILEMITRVNEKEKLELDKIQIKDLSKSVLGYIGGLMQARRHTDCVEVLRSRVTGEQLSKLNQEEESDEMKSKFAQNDVDFKDKLHKTLATFSEKQDNPTTSTDNQHSDGSDDQESDNDMGNIIDLLSPGLSNDSPSLEHNSNILTEMQSHPITELTEHVISDSEPTLNEEAITMNPLPSNPLSQQHQISTEINKALKEINTECCSSSSLATRTTRANSKAHVTYKSPNSKTSRKKMKLDTETVIIIDSSDEDV